MAITSLYSNLSATISSTEYSLVNNSISLASLTTAGVYQVFIDLSAMAAGDEYQIDIKEKAAPGGTQRVIARSFVAGVQSTPIWVSPSMVLMNGWDVTMSKKAGTDRSIAWSIRQVA